MRVFATILLIVISFLGTYEVSKANEFRKFTNVPYLSDSISKDQKLDIYVPKKKERFSTMPVHIFVHGGAWTKGDKRLKKSEVKAYTDEDIILVSVNYRLGPKYKYPANVEDVIHATKWVKNNIAKYGGDPSNIVLSGHSAGAHLVALVGVGTPDVPSLSSGNIYKAIFSVDAASYDLTKPSEGKLSRFLNKQIRKVFGVNKTNLRRASPVHQIERTGSYSNFYLYVTASRPDAVQHMRNFEKTLSDAGQPVVSHIMSRELSHSDMRKAIFDPYSQIFEAITRSLKY